MKVILAFLLLGIAATVYERQFNEALGAVIENVGRRLQGEQAVALPDDAKEVEDDLYEELKDLPDILEQEQLAALVESGAEYGWLKKKWKQIRKGAEKVAKNAVKGAIIAKVVNTIG